MAKVRHQSREWLGQLHVFPQRHDQDENRRRVTITYTYDLADNLRSETYPSGRVVSYQYHASGRVNDVRTNKAGQTTPDILATGLLYGAHGAMRRMSLLSGKTEEWCYNSRLQTTRIRVGNAASSQNNCDLAVSDLLWLGLGYRTGVANNGDIVSQNIQPVNVNQTFGYDPLGRISAFTDPQFSETYGYDRWGNRWLTARTGGIPGGVPNGSSWFDPGKNQMRVTPGSAQPACPNALYDCAGNQTSSLGVQLTYDGENRVAEAIRTVGGVAEIYRHYYDGEGRRVGTSAEIGGVDKWTTAFVYDAMGKMVAEYTGGAAAATAAGRTFVSVDHLGSTRMTTDGSGGNVRRFDYLPFGESLATTSRTVALGYAGAGPRMMFTGQQRDGESGLDYFGARHMLASQGRFTSTDPENASASLFTPQAWNAYSYALNNPYKYVDPDGEVPLLVSGAIGAGVGLVGGAVFNAGGQLLSNGFDFRSIDLKQVGSAALGGAVQGGIAGLTLGVGTAAVGIGEAALANGAANVIGGIVTRGTNELLGVQPAPNAPSEGTAVAVDFAMGAIGGAYGARRANVRYPLPNVRKELAIIANSNRRSLRPAKVEAFNRYANEQQIRNTVGSSVLGTSVMGFFSDLFFRAANVFNPPPVQAKKKKDYATDITITYDLPE